MNIVIVGTGYVGLVTGACFARMGNRVTCVDIDARKVALLRRGQVPIFEPGLEDLVRERLETGELAFTTDLSSAIPGASVIFLTVGTPTDASGGSDLTALYAAARSIGSALSHPVVLVTKSTVPIGTTERLGALVRDEQESRGVVSQVSLVNNPEFLKEGAALEDFMTPDRVVLGGDDPRALALMKELYRPFLRSHDRFIEMDLRSSEMTKYASNAMLATRISFMNEVAAICGAVGADVNLVRVGVGSDPRIGYSFLYPGTGFGGSCFPKDLRALIRTAQACEVHSPLLEAVVAVNENQKSVLVRMVAEEFGDDLGGLTFAVWGLAFKPETDDLREAPSLVVIRDLVARGAHVRAYDPKALAGARELLADLGDAVTWCESKYEALRGGSALLLLTEWKEFRSPDFGEMARLLRRPVIFDGRNQYNRQRMADDGFYYRQVGAPVLAAEQVLV
ncbi:MAG: UDP-glucose/GDP-mannose dehydrogenase family protein [Spirochaetales bacterium]